jgi:hypothetical protein
MTALKPLEVKRVMGVSSVRYPLNKICAHPECSETDLTAHHLFPRSTIGNGSWFVLINPKDTVRGGEAIIASDAIPHVTGLCGHGTAGHHGDLEEHRSWVKLEDGLWVWYEETEGDWRKVGPLNPQPGSVEGKTKRRRRLKDEARRKRRTISIRVPDDQEDGGALWDEMFEYICSRLVREGLYEEGHPIPVFEGVFAALADWRNSEGTI